MHLLDLMLWFMGPVAQPARARHMRDDGRLRKRGRHVSASLRRDRHDDDQRRRALSFKPWERVEMFGRNAFLVVEDQFETDAL